MDSKRLPKERYGYMTKVSMTKACGMLKTSYMQPVAYSHNVGDSNTASILSPDCIIDATSK